MLGLALGAAHADPGGDYHALVEQGEQALQRNDADAALRAYERAATLRHEAVAEWGLVRSWMQSGEYRRALGFSAHAAGAHPNMAEGAGLYAWLLHIGGQPALARQALDEALRRHPGNALLEAADARLRSPASLPDMRLLEGAARYGPYASLALPATAFAAASGLLLPDGAHAVVPAAAVAGAQKLWVRDAQGRTVAARAQREVPELGLTELVFDTPLREPTAPWPAAARDAFPGSPQLTLAFAAPAGTVPVPAWPVLQAGFVGHWQSGSRYTLGAEPAGNTAQGAPVIDRAGQLIGVVLREGDAPWQLLAVSGLRAQWPEAFAVAQPGSAGNPAAVPTVLSPDAAYERAMPQVLQLIVLPADVAMR